MDVATGILNGAIQKSSPNYNDRPDAGDISLLVIHNISLPPGEFGSTWIEDFFLNNLDHSAHPYFETISELQVSSHLLIKRDGQCVQFVPFNKRAWHAGVSCFNGRENCNDYSIGIELEGTDSMPYTNDQYQALAKITNVILAAYPKLTMETLAGHNQIAPGRKTDPGDSFDWAHYRSTLDCS